MACTKVFAAIMDWKNREVAPNHIDNTIDNGWISILQQIEIQQFNFLYLCQLIDKASLGLDKVIFAWGFVLLLQCKHRNDASESS